MRRYAFRRASCRRTGFGFAEILQLKGAKVKFSDFFRTVQDKKIAAASGGTHPPKGEPLAKPAVNHSGAIILQSKGKRD